MARGWESKAVESQQAEAGRGSKPGPALTPEARQRLDRVRTLSLALSRVRDQLSRATAPGHRAMLEQAAATLEAEIAGLSA
jgi:hypothetical protein